MFDKNLNYANGYMNPTDEFFYRFQANIIVFIGLEDSGQSE